MAGLEHTQENLLKRWSSLLLFITLFPQLCRAQPGTCLLPTALKSGTLSYVRYPPVSNPNFRFNYKLILEANNAPEPDLDVLYIVQNGNPNAATSVGWTLDSIRKVTGVADPCIFLPAAPSFVVYYYHADVELGSSQMGFLASVTNCCLPINAANLVFLPDYLDYTNETAACDEWPGEGPQGNGMSNAIAIPPVTVDFINSTPVFTSIDTILYVCQNRPLSYRIVAVDPDKDSIAYHLGNPKTFSYDGAGRSLVKNHTSFPSIQYKPPYSALQPVGSGVTLDPVTGQLDGPIADTGIYVITVAAVEYRNGKLLDSITQNLNIHVYNCGVLPKPVAAFPSETGCDSYTVDFANNSRPIYTDVNFSNTTFQWDFGDGTTSSQQNPAHTYADTGTYHVRLIIFPGLYCADTAYNNALVYPSLTPGFTWQDSCSSQLIQFTNTSSATGGVIDSAHWTILKDTQQLTTINSYNASFSFAKAPQTYTVLLTVSTDKGCQAIDTQFVNIYQSPRPLASHDTILSIGATLQLEANDGNFGNGGAFAWSPSIGLSDTSIADPILNSTIDTTYYVTITNAHGCTLTDSIRVKYYAGPTVYVPNAFTPNSDGRNDLLKPIPVGVSHFSFFRVYNRWGQLLFETSQPFQGWDGRFRGQLMPAGAYVWEVAGVDYRHRAFDEKGSVLLIR
ncbi:MAG TPA: PKD domain-containing protein [Puia sp.]|nr:PKD domain-containing protein [Puia sp.]